MTTMTEPTVAVLEGRVRIGDWRESEDVLLLNEEPFTEKISELLGHSRRQVSIRYFISPDPMTEEQRIDAQVRLAVGEGYAEFLERYSEDTGYLWTDAEFVVGGHDMMDEIAHYAGSWLWMELKIHGV